MLNFLLTRRSLLSKFGTLNKIAMKERMIRLFGKLLGLLGFAAVGTSCDGLMSLEYGTPYTSFEVTGKLIDKETKEPVSGIVIVYGEEHSDWDAAGNETRRFYPEGSHVSDYEEFWLRGRMFTPENPEKLILKLSDYDSNDKGHYKDTTYTIDLQRIREPDPEEHWCDGIYGAEVTLELEKVK